MSASKKKLTKTEKEKLKKEEEEKKRQEEEEARQKAQREEEERLEREKAEAEETRRLENEERKRRKGQLEELENMWMTNRNTLLDQAAERRVKAKWDRYMKCDGSPDPTIAGEINTYMNLWREDKKRISIHDVLHDSKLCLELIDELQFILADTPAEEIIDVERTQYNETVDELERLVQSKIDLASHDLLLKGTALADAETLNLQKVISNDLVMLCMWGNLSKNPRIKSFEFEEVGFTFELPKVLTLTDCAFRILFTQYDHYSAHCKTNLPRPKVKVEEEPPAEEPKEGEEGENAEEGEGEKKEGEGEAGEGDAETEKEKSGLEREETELRQMNGEEEPKKEEEEEKQEEEAMEEDYEIKTPEPVDWEDFDGEEDVVDLRANHIMGPIFHFNLLQLPPQPKQVRDWVMTQIIEPAELTPLDYIVEEGNGPPASAQSKDKGDDESDKPKKEDKPPIGVSMKLPKDVYFCEEPQVCRWDEAGKQWRMDGFSDHTFDEENKVLSFKVSTFGVMALTQDAHINMPFQSWEIRPKGANHALLTIIAAIIEVEIEIKDGLCCVLVTEDKPEISSFKDKWMQPEECMRKLRQAGINVFPDVDSHKYVSVQSKNAITEERLYQQIAMTVSTMAYSWSKWNAEIKSEDRIVIQGAEHLEDEPLLEEDWSLFLITKKRTTKLKMTEFDENFSDEHAEGTEFHADLYHMTYEISSAAGKERMDSTTHAFTDAVYQIMKGTRLVTFS